MKKLLLQLILLTSISFFALGQSKIKVLHYNLLYYGQTSRACNSSNNNITQKNGYLKTIIKYAKPDIFTVNEMGADFRNAAEILGKALNIDGVDYYDDAKYSSNGSNLANMLFYNKEKLVLHEQFDIQKAGSGSKIIRQVDHYRLYYNDPASLQYGDTVWLNVLVAHLKAGDASADKEERFDAVKGIMKYLAENKNGENFILCGDLNVQRASEESFNELINSSNTNINFKDPVNAVGTWHNSAQFAFFHTQSTRTSGSCHSGGGLDDRFDFILIGNELTSGAKDVQYVNKSYETMGNNGNLFNKSLNGDNNNSSVPGDVINALYEMSDHLPVSLELQFTINNSGQLKLNTELVKFNNPVIDEFTLRFQHKNVKKPVLKIYDLQGRLVQSAPIQFSDNNFEIKLNLSELKSSLYIINIYDQNQRIFTDKLLKL